MISVSQKWGQDYLKHINDRCKAPTPSIMIMLLNTKCNLRCQFCDLYKGNEEITFEDCIKVLAEGAELGVSNLVLTGGEPFLHKDLFRIIKYAKELGYGVNVTTNGTLINETLEKIVDSGVDSVSVSIDGLEKTHDMLRGKKGSFKKAFEGIKLLVKKLGKKKVAIYFVVTNKNVKELKEIYNLSLGLGVKFDFWPVNDVKEFYLKKDDDIKEYSEFIDYIDKKDPNFKGKKEYYKKALDYHQEKDMRVRCLGLCNHFGINVNGELQPCCMWGGHALKIGNVFHNSLAELWHSDKARDVRKQIFEKGCRNECYNHALYEFSQITNMSFVVRE
nr:radical SAM protein [Nanoarchaeota archaeon]